SEHVRTLRRAWAGASHSRSCKPASGGRCSAAPSTSSFSFGATPRRIRLSAEVRLRHVSGLRVERDGVVLRVTLARPERRNAFDAALIAELNEAFAEVGDARAVVLSGEGPSFSAGADVEW